MKTNNNLKIRTNTANHRSYFDWGSKMQVIRKGNGEIAMTESSELVKFFGVTWRKLNHRLKTIMKSSNLHPDERDAGEEVIKKGKTVSYSPLYPPSYHHRPVLSIGQHGSAFIQRVYL